MSQTQLSVSLLSHTLDPEITVALGGRLCYSDSRIAALRPAVEPRAEEFVGKLTELGHLSPVEHASFTFGVEGVSRALLAQITRHRIASFSVQSQRYVAKPQGFPYILPPSIRALGPEAEAEYVRQMQTLADFYAGWLQKGIPAEDARFLLPNAAETRMLVTMNARELLHFFSLRCCNRAQWEIRRLAWAMLALCRQAAPALFGGLGAPCLCGPCPEGKMSCGKAEETRALSASLDALLRDGAKHEEILSWVEEHIGCDSL